MNVCRLICILLISLTSLNANAEIYKCTNSQGKTQYSDKPCGGDESVFTPRAAPPATQTGLTDEERRAKRQKLLDAFQAERSQKKQAEAEALNNKKERQQQCAQARDYYRSVIEAGSVYDLDEQGNRVNISDSERVKETARAKEAMQYWCGK